MKILNFGSLNIDYVYRMPHIVESGETITSRSLSVFCGGKGLNQSIAMARAGLLVYHGGLIGHDGQKLLDGLEKSGVNTDEVKVIGVPTGNAIIQVDDDGQNCILLYPGANREMTEDFVDEVLSHFSAGDIIVLQNEINRLDQIIDKAYEKKMTVYLNPSPFDEKVMACDLKKVSWFFINETEGRQMTGEKEAGAILDRMKSLWPESRTVLTMGSKGCWYGDKKIRVYQKIFETKTVDTTAAGDTFTGYFIQAVVNGKEVKKALEQAALAASMAVSRTGASDSIPTMEEVKMNGRRIGVKI